MTRATVILLALLTLGGCRYYVAGHSADFSMIVSGEGDLDILTGASTFTLTVDGQSIRCSGNSKTTLRTGNIIGDRAAATLTCTDGRSASGELVVTSLEGGTGAGRDECGNQFELVWGTGWPAIERQLENFRGRARSASLASGDKCEGSSQVLPPHRDPLA